MYGYSALQIRHILGILERDTAEQGHYIFIFKLQIINNDCEEDGGDRADKALRTEVFQ